jgi:HEAT repeat protein
MTSRQVNLLIAVIIMIAHASAVLAQTRAVPGSSGNPRLSNAPGKKHGPPGKAEASDSKQDTRVISGSETTDYTHETGVLVSPRGAWAWPTFKELAHKGGPKVSALGRICELYVPAEMRFRPVAGRQLVEAVAAGRGFNTIWLRDGQHVIIYAGAEKDEDLQRVEKELSSTNALVRRNAVWDGVRTWDVRAVPLIAKAAQDENADVVREAMAGLETLGWDNVFLLLGDAALPLAAMRLKSRDEYSRKALACGLALGGEGAIPLLELAMAEWHGRGGSGLARHDAVWAMGQIGGEKARAILQKALGDSDINLRRYSAPCAMGRPGDDQALPILEQLLRHQDAGIRAGAAAALGRVGGKRAIELLEKAIADPDLTVRLSARLTLLWQGPAEKKLRLLEQALGDRDKIMRETAAYALGGAWDDSHSGGREYANGAETGVLDRNQVLVLAKKATRDQDERVRGAAVMSLGRIGGDEALALLRDLFAKDSSTYVRSAVLASLGSLGDKRATAILADALTHSRDREIRSAACYGLAIASDPTAVPLLAKAASESGDAWEALLMIGGDDVFAAAEKELLCGKPTLWCGLTHEALTGDQVSHGFLGGGWGVGYGGGGYGGGWGGGGYGGGWGVLDCSGGRGARGSALPRKDRIRMRAFLEREELNVDRFVRPAVIDGYGVVGGEKGYAFLDAMIRDKDVRSRQETAYVLGWMGGARARDLLIGRLTLEKDRAVSDAIRNSLNTGFHDDPVAEQALKDAGARAQQ